MRPFLRASLAAVGFLTLISCGGGDGATDPPSSNAPTLRLIVGAGASDTIEGRLVDPLVVTVQDASGRPAANVPLRFRPHGGLGVAPHLAGSYRESLDVSTGTDGRASAWIQLGRTVGVQHVQVEVVGATARDSAAFVVQPGQPLRLVVGPHDSAAYVGGGYQLRALADDRLGNPTDVPVTYAGLRSAVASVSGAGVMHAEALGRATVIARADTLVDTVYISVVPPGRIAARVSSYSGEPAVMYIFDTDGSSYRPIPYPSPFFNTIAPHWSPAGDEIVYHELEDIRDPFLGERLYVMDTLGNARRLLESQAPLRTETQPQYSRDGQWIYFSALVGEQETELWRASADGALAERVGPVAGMGSRNFTPSPSPDGSRLAYVTNETPTFAPVLRVLDLVSGTIDSIDVPGAMPRWSPTSDEIAYLDDFHLRIVHADGSGRIDMDPTREYETTNGSIDWSPDGEWLVACTVGGTIRGPSLVLVRRSSREVLPLAYTAGHRLCEATWRP